VNNSWPVDEFAKYLRALMDAAGIETYAELSRLTDVSQNQFSNWRRGLARPSHELLRKIAPVLHVKPAALWYQAGLQADGDIDQAVDVTVWPPEFHTLREIYERFAAAGRGEEVLDAIGTLTLGLQARIGKPRSSVRRRAG
jgi:transcriptional regulator with XRE-family HTH domain